MVVVVAQAGRHQAYTLEEIERAAAALREVSDRLGVYIARLHEVTDAQAADVIAGARFRNGWMSRRGAEN